MKHIKNSIKQDKDPDSNIIKQMTVPSLMHRTGVSGWCTCFIVVVQDCGSSGSRSTK